MAEVSENSGTYPKVRDLIFVYERNTSVSEPVERFEGRRRAKSIGNALSYKQFRQTSLEIHNIVDIEKELVKIEAHLNYYEVYQKETHVAFQEQLFNILTSIVSIDPEGLESTIQKNKDLIEETQKLAKVLNSKLPYDSSHSHQNMKRSYSHLVRKEEAVVSSTSTKTQEHKTIFSSSNSSFLNNDFKSEESSNSTDLCSKQEDFSKLEQSIETASPPPPINITSESEGSYIPSVSRLKKFFSFRKENKSEIKVIPAAYSGVARSQSLRLKTSKYTVSKREKHEESNISSDHTISENNEDIKYDNNGRLITSSPLPYKREDANNDEQDIQNIEISLYNEPTRDIEEYREEHKTEHNMSVSKLKSMFEEKQKETDEGLGLLTKKQFRSDFSLPYTEANLGAFRLKRTISGNYMNFTGLLRNVEIQKKVDLNKSKSLSDLKYVVKDIEVDDLTKELDDNDDFEHVGGKRTDEVNNNDIIKTEGKISRKSAKEEHATSNTIEELKHMFDNTNKEVNTKKNVEALKTSFEQKVTEKTVREDVLHKTVESISNLSEEPVKADAATGKVEMLKYTFDQINTKDRENEFTEYQSISSKESNDITLKITPSYGKADYSSDNRVEQQHVLNETETYATTGIVETLKHTFETTNTAQKASEDTKYAMHITTEPIYIELQSPGALVRLGTNYHANNDIEKHVLEEEEAYITSGAVGHLKQAFEQKATEENNGDIKHIFHKTVEPSSSFPKESNESVLNVPPIQPKMDFSTDDPVAEQTLEFVSKKDHMRHQEQHVITGTVEALKQTFEHVSEENNEFLPYSGNTLEKTLEVPVQQKIESSSIISHTEEQIVAAGEEHVIQKETLLIGTVEALKQTFERSNSESATEDVEYASHKCESSSNPSITSSNKLLLEVPNQFKTDFAAISRTENQVAGTLEHVRTGTKEEIIGHVAHSTIETTNFEVPSEIRTKFSSIIYNEEGFKDKDSLNVNSSPLPISLYDETYTMAEHSSSGEINSSKAQIESKTQSLMKILESPSSVTTSVSNSSYNEGVPVNSSSNASVSYSQKTSVQRTSSTHVSHQILSSSSSSRNYLQVQEQEPSSSYSVFTSLKSRDLSNDEEDDTITITEIKDSVDEEDKPKKRLISLNISQENILEEILDDSKELENVDDEFEKILTGN